MCGACVRARVCGACVSTRRGNRRGHLSEPTFLIHVNTATVVFPYVRQKRSDRSPRSHLIVDSWPTPPNKQLLAFRLVRHPLLMSCLLSFNLTFNLHTAPTPGPAETRRLAVCPTLMAKLVSESVCERCACARPYCFSRAAAGMVSLVPQGLSVRSCFF